MCGCVRVCACVRADTLQQPEAGAILRVVSALAAATITKPSRWNNAAALAANPSAAGSTICGPHLLFSTPDDISMLLECPYIQSVVNELESLRSPGATICGSTARAMSFVLATRLQLASSCPSVMQSSTQRGWARYLGYGYPAYTCRPRMPASCSSCARSSATSGEPCLNRPCHPSDPSGGSPLSSIRGGVTGRTDGGSRGSESSPARCELLTRTIRRRPAAF